MPFPSRAALRQRIDAACPRATGPAPSDSKKANPRDFGQMSRHAEPVKERYAEDPVYREKKRAFILAHYAIHQGQIGARRHQPWHTLPARREQSRARRSRPWRSMALKKKYGMTLEGYDRLLAQQHGACAICKTAAAETLCVDQRHW